MSAIFRLFDIFALIYVFRSLQLTAVIWREWRSLLTVPFNRHKKHLAEQAAFFIAVPIGVLIHELGHALAVWGFGGQVVEFGYRAFWGYVLPAGNFTPNQDWFISLAGTLGSLIFGLAIWLALRGNRSPFLRYFGLRSFRFQVYFSLIYYPIFTLIGFVGDWREIYNFSATPLASGLTAPFHAGMLILFWIGDRTGWFERVSHETTAAQEQFTQIAQAFSDNPDDTAGQLRYIDSLRQGGALNKADHALKAFLKQHPDSGAGFLQLAAVQSSKGQQIPRRAVNNARKALSLGIPTAAGTAVAHQIIGRYSLDTGKLEDAIHHFSQAIGALGSHGSNMDQLYHQRSQAYRRAHQFESAYQDVNHALQLVTAAGNQKKAALYQSEITLIEKHAGHSFSHPPTVNLPEGGDI